GSLQRSRSSHSTPGSSPSYAGGPPRVSRNQPSWKSLNPSSSQPSRHSLLASWPMTYWCPVSCTMRPIDALPSMIIMGNSVPPRRLTVAPLLVDVVRIERESEMMDVFGPKADALPARSDTHRRTPGSRERGAVPLALIVDPEILVRFRVVPARVSLHRNPSSADYLVLWQIEHDVERGELTVELAPRIERMVFPTVAVVHHHLGIPLREVEAPPLAPLAPRQSGWT